MNNTTIKVYDIIHILEHYSHLVIIECDTLNTLYDSRYNDDVTEQYFTYNVVSINTSGDYDIELVVRRK